MEADSNSGITASIVGFREVTFERDWMSRWEGKEITLGICNHAVSAATT